jgi:hypothetical protein
MSLLANASIANVVRCVLVPLKLFVKAGVLVIYRKRWEVVHEVGHLPPGVIGD